MERNALLLTARKGMDMEIIPNLWHVGGSGLTAVEDAAVYLVRFGDQAFLVDAGSGFGHHKLIGNISKVLPADVEIVYLLLTHCHFDHTGGAAAVRAEYGCGIVAHELEAAYLESANDTVTAAEWYGAHMSPLTIDVKISGKKEIMRIGDGEVTLYHCPGHSPGSMVFTVTMDGQRVLFGQDVHGPLDPMLLSNRDEYLQSLRFLLDLEADILCEGHFGVFRGKKAVARFINSYLTAI
jgi:glyoxylase-like metal-dependent hydrolase (beta-lactamase superfamily II)